MKISIIVAMAQNGVIGKHQALPWHLPTDLQFFKQTTLHHCVLSGRKNYFSIPEKFRPLPQRTNIVLTQDRSFSAQGCHIVYSLQEGIAFAKASGESELFIIGGAQVFAMALQAGLVDRIYLTQLAMPIEGDVFFSLPSVGNWQKTLLFKHEKDEQHFCAFQVWRWDRV